MAEDRDSRINTARQSMPVPDASPRSRALDREQHYPNETEERSAAKQRLNDTGTGCEPVGVEPDIADADKTARTGGSQDRVRNTPPFGDWDETGPVKPDPERRT